MRDDTKVIAQYIATIQHNSVLKEIGQQLRKAKLIESVSTLGGGKEEIQDAIKNSKADESDFYDALEKADGNIRNIYNGKQEQIKRSFYILGGSSLSFLIIILVLFFSIEKPALIIFPAIALFLIFNIALFKYSNTLIKDLSQISNDLRKNSVMMTYLKLLMSLDEKDSRIKDVLSAAVINGMNNTNQQSVFNFSGVETQLNANDLKGNANVKHNIL